MKLLTRKEAALLLLSVRILRKNYKYIRLGQGISNALPKEIVGSIRDTENDLFH